MARAKVDIQLRWGDEDAYGHINNVAFLRYLEEARVRILWSGSGHEKTGMEGHFRGDTPGGLKTLVVDNHCPTKPTLIRCVRGSIHTEKHIHRVLRRAFGTSARGTHSEVYPAEALSHPVVRSTLGEAA